MPEKIYTYESDEITVTWDLKKCIHAKECVHGLPGVFDINKKPWIQPSQGSADEVARVIERCPTGALQYSRNDESKNEEAPKKNTIALVKNGPIYIEGDINLKKCRW